MKRKLFFILLLFGVHMPRSVLFLLPLLLFFSMPAMAQRITVSGEVVDEESLPLIRTTVHVKGTTIGAVRDLDGNYRLEVNPNDTLIFNFIGYQELTVPVSGRVLINVTLQPSSIMLGDLVVVGYGVQTKASVVGAIAQATGDEIKLNYQGSNLADNLSGLMPGVITMRQSGVPGGGCS